MAQRIASWSSDATMRDRFPGGEASNFLFYFFRVLWWDVRKRCLRKGGGVTCENPLRLSMYDGAMEGVDDVWVIIWCMLHAKLDCWSLSQSCRNARLRENMFSSRGIEPGLQRWELAVTSTMLPAAVVLQISLFIVSYYHSPGLTLDTLLSPAAAQDIFPCPITPWDSAESIYIIPTMGSSPSFFLRSLAIQFPPWPETHFTCLWLNKKAVSRPSYHLTITQSSILFW